AELVENGKLPRLSQLLAHAEQTCRAVGFAHQRGVIHRDLKPSNIMLTGQGVIKVLDFGIAHLGDCGPAQAETITGTPSYMSPEQAAGQDMDQRSDVFSLGAVFYELFTGKKPFSGETAEVMRKVLYEEPVAPSAIKPSLSSGVETIILRALAKDRLKRFQDCEAMAAAFRRQAKLLESAPQIGVATPANRASATWAGAKPTPASST